MLLLSVFDGKNSILCSPGSEQLPFADDAWLIPTVDRLTFLGWPIVLVEFQNDRDAAAIPRRPET